MSAPEPAGRVRELPVALRLEALKLVRSRSSAVLALIAVVVSSVAAVFFAGVAAIVLDGGVTADSEELYSFTIVRASLAPVAAGVIGALLTGSEFRHRQWATTLLRLPRRHVVLAAAYLVAASAAIALSVVTFAATMAVSLFEVQRITGVAPVGQALVLSALGHAVTTAGCAVAGAALGILLRSRIGAVAIFVALVYVVEPALAAVLNLVGSPATLFVAHHLPLAAGARLALQLGDASPVLLAEAGAGAASSAAVFVVFVAGLVALSTWSFVRQDVRT